MAGKKRPAVFLDRDGVLAEEKGYVASVDELEIFPYAEQCVRQIHEKGYYAIVATNQSGVARGIFTEGELLRMNEYLMLQTGVDAVYYCPHLENGVVERYRQRCKCRKPGTGMFAKACGDYAIDMQKSYMVGDRAGDILAGQNAGVRTILLESGYGTVGLEWDVKPDYVLGDLRDVAGILV